MDHPETPRPSLGVWLDDDPFELVQAHLDMPGCGWSVGTWGAIGEFSFERDEAGLTIDRERLTVRTQRGGLRVSRCAEVRALAISAADDHDRVREIALCLPLMRARRAGQERITCRGPDIEAIAPGDRECLLFDLGVGAPHIDMNVCVASGASQLLSALRAAVGRSFLEDRAASGAVLEYSPPRVLVSALARLEVRAPIPPPGGRSPDGPHSHLLPHLLAQRRTQGPGSPIPEDWVCGLSIYPLRA